MTGVGFQEKGACRTGSPSTPKEAAAEMGILPPFGQNLLGGLRMRRPGGHLYYGPKPIIPERLSAHVQAFPCFPLPSSFD